MQAVSEMKIYHWIDKEGNSHFSDTADPNTEEVQLKEQNVFVEEFSAPPASPTQDMLTDEAVIEYVATIVSPTDDQAIRSNEGTINIQVSTTPEKENSQKLQLYLDGVALGQPQISPTISAQNIDRGTHQLEVHLIDENDKLLAKTQVVTVHLQRVHINRAVAIPK